MSKLSCKSLLPGAFFVEYFRFPFLAIPIHSHSPHCALADQKFPDKSFITISRQGVYFDFSAASVKNFESRGFHSSLRLFQCSFQDPKSGMRGCEVRMFPCTACSRSNTYRCQSTCAIRAWLQRSNYFSDLIGTCELCSLWQARRPFEGICSGGLKEAK